MGRLIDLSHPLFSGVQTYPWLPAPKLTEFLSREASKVKYAPGTEFAIHRIELIGNSGTYLDAPFHRYADGLDLADLSLERLADLPGCVIDVTKVAMRGIGAGRLPTNREFRGAAMLFRTGWDTKWRMPDYGAGAPFLTESLAEELVRRGVSLVGIDALNVDDTDDPARPAHTILLGAGIPIVENLRGLDLLSSEEFRFTAVPARVAGCGAFPVRAYAVQHDKAAIEDR
jgi:arylformamidase